VSEWLALPEDLLLVLTVLCALPADLAASLRLRLAVHGMLLLLVLAGMAASAASPDRTACALAACAWTLLQLAGLARLPEAELSGVAPGGVARNVLLPLLSVALAATGLRLFPGGSLPPLERDALGRGLAVLLAALPAVAAAPAGGDASLALILVGDGLLLLAGSVPGGGWEALLFAVLFQLVWLVRAWRIGKGRSRADEAAA